MTQHLTQANKQQLKDAGCPDDVVNKIEQHFQSHGASKAPGVAQKAVGGGQIIKLILDAANKNWDAIEGDLQALFS